VSCSMSRTEAAEMILLLSSALGVSAPGMRWSDRARRGRYGLVSMLIVVGPRCWRGAEASILHEFAHHVVNVRNPYRWERGGRINHHGPDFIEALRLVVSEWYGMASYPWGTEYASIRRSVAGAGK